MHEAVRAATRPGALFVFGDAVSMALWTSGQNSLKLPNMPRRSVQAPFSPALFRFLEDLAEHNNREWFAEHKAEYERDVKTPLLRFIETFAPHLEKISPHFVADPRPNGGSMFRIYRDTRFSKNKSPYKTHAAAQFRHELGKDVHAPGFYLHLEPGQVFMGAGIWHPDRDALGKIRTAIAEAPQAWKKSISAKAFTQRFQLGGESLKRPPKGFDPEHSAIEDLKRKDFIASADFAPDAAFSPEFLKTFIAACKAASPFMRFLTEAMELTF